MNNDSRVVAARIIVTFAWTAVIVGVGLTFASESPFWEMSKLRNQVVYLMPQGWAFFTRDPQEATDSVYEHGSAEWRKVAEFRARSRSIGELFQRARIIHVELAHVLTQVRSNEWTQCVDGVASCTARGSHSHVVVENRSSFRNLCGSYLVERQPPVPWAWSSSRLELYMPSRIVQLDVRCGDAHPNSTEDQGSRAGRDTGST